VGGACGNREVVAAVKKIVGLDLNHENTKGRKHEKNKEKTSETRRVNVGWYSSLLFVFAFSYFRVFVISPRQS
jgi:hypothetical protein